MADQTALGNPKGTPDANLEDVEKHGGGDGGTKEATNEAIAPSPEAKSTGKSLHCFIAYNPYSHVNVQNIADPRRSPRLSSVSFLSLKYLIES